MTEEIVRVELQNITRVEKDIYYMRTSEGNVRLYGSRIVANTVNQSKKIFRNAIQRYVYDIPPTTYDRTNALANGVRSRGFSKGLGGGEIYVDPNIVGANGYFYPSSVEWGLKSKPSYWGRHYWARGKSEAIIQFRKDAEPFVHELAAKIMGR
jgi:hypothetical protein